MTELSRADWQLLLLIIGHTEKIYSVKFHPLASGVLVSSSYDMTVRLWNLESGEQVKLLTGHEDQVGEWEPGKTKDTLNTSLNT